MSRSERLFDLLQILRRYRGTVSGQTLASEAGVSLRTIRRDIATLQSLGADIDAQAGVGYALRPGLLLPPLAFTDEEIQALVLGAKWVASQTDVALSLAVRNAMAKIDGITSPSLRGSLDDTTFYISDAPRSAASALDIGPWRRAVRERRKLLIGWRDDDGTERLLTVWPIMVGFDGAERSFAGWCEQERRYRIFDRSRIVHSNILAERYPGHRGQMLKEWRSVAARLCARETPS